MQKFTRQGEQIEFQSGAEKYVIVSSYMYLSANLFVPLCMAYIYWGMQ